MAARQVFVAVGLPLAVGLSLLRVDDAAGATKKAMVATVFEHTRVTPVDMMLGHQLRMLSGSRKNVAQVAVINAKVPGVDRQGGTTHDPVLANLQRSFGTTGSVRVVNLEENLTEQVAMFQKVFSLQEGSTTGFAKNLFFKQELASDHAKRQMAFFQGMLQFFDLCSQADAAVELCINMEAESLLVKNGKIGLLDLASELFDEDKQVLALRPPTYCEYTHANHRPSWVKRDKWGNNSFVKCTANTSTARPESGTASLVFNRERLMAALPLSINKADIDLEKGFDHAFMAGLLSRSESLKGMQCGHAFVIHQSTEEAKCKGRRVNFAHQAKAASRAEHREQADFVASEYTLFDQTLVRGLGTILSRVENGRIPPVMGSVGNKCQEMCPSTERIVKEGFAW